GYMGSVKGELIAWAKSEVVLAKGLGLLDEANWSALYCPTHNAPRWPTHQGQRVPPRRKYEKDSQRTGAARRVRAPQVRTSGPSDRGPHRQPELPRHHQDQRAGR